MKREWGLRGKEKFDLGTFEIRKILTKSPVLIEIKTSLTQINVTYLGIQYENSKSGAFAITNVIPGSPASSAGLLQGDIIYGIDGKKVSREEGLNAVDSSHLPGDVITISIIRGSNHQAIKLTLGTDRSKGGWLDPLFMNFRAKLRNPESKTTQSVHRDKLGKFKRSLNAEGLANSLFLLVIQLRRQHKGYFSSLLGKLALRLSAFINEHLPEHRCPNIGHLTLHKSE